MENKSIVPKSMGYVVLALAIGFLPVGILEHYHKKFQGYINKNEVKYDESLLGREMGIYNSTSRKKMCESSLISLFRDENKKNQSLYFKLFGIELVNSFKDNDLKSLKNYCDDIRNEVYKRTKN